MSDTDLLEQLAAWVQGRFFGKYRGQVRDNDDPTGRGRLRVVVPAVLGDAEVWAMPCVPYAGNGVGLFAMPEPGTGIWVEFEAGDPSFAIWTGCFWADNEVPEAATAGVKIWRTEALTLRLDDDGRKLTAESDAGASLALESDAVIEAGGSSHTVGGTGVVSDGGGGHVEVGSATVSINRGALEVS